MAREAPVGYQRQLSEPGLQYPPQGFKQEYHDPRYEQASRAGSSCQYPAAVVVKQEQVDYVYDSGINWVLPSGGCVVWETGCGVGNAINWTARHAQENLGMFTLHTMFWEDISDRVEMRYRNSKVMLNLPRIDLRHTFILFYFSSRE